MAYAQMLDLPFAFSSNGDGFAEHDFLTGMERQFGMDEFPTEEELIARYKTESGITPQQESIQQQPYYSSQNIYPPRYYQRIAINRTVDAIARGQDRLLLVMATGTGKTYTAFQIVYRLLQSCMKRKILYLADRNILVDQSISDLDVPSDCGSNVHAFAGGLSFPDSTVCTSGNNTIYDIQKQNAWHLRKRAERIGELS